MSKKVLLWANYQHTSSWRSKVLFIISVMFSKKPIPHCLCLSTCVSVHPTSLQLLNSLAKHKAMGLQSQQSQGNLAMRPQPSFQLETSSTFRRSPSLPSLTLVKFQNNFKGKKGFLSYNKNKAENIYGQDTAKIFRADLKIIFPPPLFFFFFCTVMRKVNFHLTRNIFIQIKFCANLDFSTRKQMHSEDRRNS